MFLYIILVFVSGFLILKMIFKNIDKQIVSGLDERIFPHAVSFFNRLVKVIGNFFLFLESRWTSFLKFVRGRRVAERNGTSLYWQDVTEHKNKKS